MNSTDQIKADKALIEQLGGPTKLAEILGYDKLRGGVQRVQNWQKRGIPPRVKIDHAPIFLPESKSSLSVRGAGRRPSPPP